MSKDTEETKKLFSNRVDASIQKKLSELAHMQLDEEIDRLADCYEHEDVFTEDKDYWKEVKFRNSAIVSQWEHLKRVAQAASGAIHPRGQNSKDENKLAKEIVEAQRAKLAKHLEEFEQRKVDAWERTKQRQEAKRKAQEDQDND